MPAFINLDFADVTSVMKDAGHAHMGIGHASGKDKAEQAAKSAISSPLLETTITGAKGVIISITASADITLEDVDTAAGIVRAQADEDANIIFGVAFDEKLDDEMIVTVIATGFGLDSNGVAKKPLYNGAMDDIHSHSDKFGSDDDMGDILDLFKSRK
jgi:cell division protein FtsZ